MKNSSRALPLIFAATLATLAPSAEAGDSPRESAGPDESVRPGGAAGPKNVLFIAVDDLRPELGCSGALYARSPHIDRLAEEGVLFENHFVQVPTCGASRYALLTGRSPARSGVTGGNAALYQGRTRLLAEQQPGAQVLAAQEGQRKPGWTAAHDGG